MVGGAPARSAGQKPAPIYEMASKRRTELSDRPILSALAADTSKGDVSRLLGFSGPLRKRRGVCTLPRGGVTRMPSRARSREAHDRAGEVRARRTGGSSRRVDRSSGCADRSSGCADRSSGRHGVAWPVRGDESCRIRVARHRSLEIVASAARSGPCHPTDARRSARRAGHLRRHSDGRRVRHFVSHRA